MKNKLINIAKLLQPTRISELAAYLLKDAAISGKLIIVAVSLALVATNTTLRPLYESFWQTHLSIGLGHWSLSLGLRDWINEVLMTVFFLAVGLELKRELLRGELRQARTALLPMAAAIGGMLVPALIYMTINAGEHSFRGWAIPMATDIAIAIGILALLGRRIPSSIRLFLLTLAIVDDIVAVIVIAIFYSNGLNLSMLGLVAVLFAVVMLLERMKRLSLGIFSIFALLLWLLIYNSGIHPSIAGVLIGLLAPLAVSSEHREAISERLERLTIPLSTLVVVPLFAFANAGIVLSFDVLRDGMTTPIAAGIIFGLVLGKMAGIAGASWLMIKLGISNLPDGSHWGHIIGVGMLAGIGFTVSIFVTDLAFGHELLAMISKMSIFLASIISGLAGIAILRFAVKSNIK